MPTQSIAARIPFSTAIRSGTLCNPGCSATPRGRNDGMWGTASRSLTWPLLNGTIRDPKCSNPATLWLHAGIAVQTTNIAPTNSRPATTKGPKATFRATAIPRMMDTQTIPAHRDPVSGKANIKGKTSHLNLGVVRK